MKRKILLLIYIGFALSLFAQKPIPVGKGSYAEYTPLYKSKTAEHHGDQSRLMEARTLYITEQNKELPVPTNDWWTDLIVERYSGNLWAYPQVVNAEEYGIYIAYPKKWTPDGREMKWDTQLEILGKKFNPVSAAANQWHDWGFDFLMKDNEKEMLVTLAHGIPFTWIESKNVVPQLRCKNARLLDETGQEIQLPFTGSRFVIQMGNDAYGIYAPDGTLFEMKNGLIEVLFTGESQYLSVAVLPSANDLAAYAGYAYTIPRKTEVVWNYDETSGEISTWWNLLTENLKGENNKDVLQGFIPHHYKNSQYDFEFTPYEYVTPRGKMKMSAGRSFSIIYKFNGILPYYATPIENFDIKNPYQKERMKHIISEYANKGGFGGDTYWGGKGLIQMALYMTFAHEIGETALFEKCKARLKDVLENWLTYTPGENSYFFARYQRWGAMVGYDTSYDSDTFNDHHFHYGYFTYASGVLALFDEDFKKNYGEMATHLAKDYANWDKDDTQYPFLRTMDPWAGHSYAGGLGGWNGNGQESSSEAMQGWGGVYLLGVATNNKAMRDAGIFGWTLEARGIAEYWYDRDRENIDYTIYDRPYNSNLTSQGIGWWTWFSGDPVWMHGIQWMPISPCLKYLYEDLDFARWDYTQMWNTKEIGSWTTELGLPTSLSYDAGIGNVVLSYLQIFEPDSAASVLDRMWEAQMPIVKDPDTGGISYYITHSNRSYGNICWDVHADMPTATTYRHPVTGRYTYMVYNPESAEKTVRFYRDGSLITAFKAPANKMTVYTDASRIEKVQIKIPASKVVEPGKELQLEAALLDQYSATVEGDIIWSTEMGGAISNTGLFSAPQDKGSVKVIARNGLLTDEIELWIDNKPVLASAQLLPEGREYLEVGSSLDFSLGMTDQYGEPYLAPVSWQIFKDGDVVKKDSVLDAQSVGIYTIKATAEGQTYTSRIYLSPKFSNIALNKRAVASSEENSGTLATNVTDGDKDTRWGSNHNNDEWIYVDLGTDSYVGYVTIVWEAAYASLYDVEISDDAKDWTAIATVTGLGKAETTQINQTARYVRVVGRERSTPYGCSIYEFEVYGVLPAGDAPALFGIDISPRSGQMKEGESITLQAIGYDQYGNVMDVNPEFSLLSGEGTITLDGVLTPSKYGQIEIEAKVGKQIAKAGFFVEESIKLSSVSITPRRVSLIKGHSQTFTADAKDQFGVGISAESLDYKLIGTEGNITGSTFTVNKVGTYYVIVGNETVSDTAIIEVAELEDTNLAFRKPATASSIENAGTLSEYINDGDRDTRWSSSFNEPEYIQIDLLDNYVIDRINLFWNDAYAKSYRIDVSLDEDTWTNAYTNNNGKGGEESFGFAPVAARYVRLWCLQRNSDYGSSVWEMEVYGSALWENPQPVKLDVTPNPAIAFIGEELQLKAVLSDQYGLDYPDTQGLKWSVSGGGTINQDGIFIPTRTGDYTLTAEYGNLTTIVSLSVLEVKELSRMEIVPHHASVKVGEEIELLLKAYDQYGNDYEVGASWNASGGTVSQSGIFSASSPGSYKVTAIYGNLSTMADIEVFEPDGLNLALNKQTDVTSGDGSAAVDGNTGTRWESSFFDGPQWLFVDLEDAYLITDVSIMWEEASASDYQIQVSQDGNTWTTIKDVAGMSGERTDNWRVNGLGRYVRVWCTKRSTGYGYSIWELRVYGRLLESGQPYTIDFIEPKMTLGLREEVRYNVAVLDKNGAEVFNPPLKWSVIGLGNISDEGLFWSHLTGQAQIKVASQQASNAISVSVYSITGNDKEELDDESVLLYPNPVSDILKISGDVAGITFYSLYGQAILTAENVDSINVSHLPKGIYIVKVTTLSGKHKVFKVKVN